MKKILSVSLILLMLLGLCACSSTAMQLGLVPTPTTAPSVPTYPPMSIPGDSQPDDPSATKPSSPASQGGEYFSLSMFRKFGVVGDSYASGAIFQLNEDGTIKSADCYYELSWGQVMARNLGTKCTNFSTGGLSTRSWLTDWKGLPSLLASEPLNIYYLMLGINDKETYNEDEIGTIEDIKSNYNLNPDTFYGNYGKIICRIQEHAPNAKFIISTMTGITGKNKLFNDAIEEIAAHFGIPCVKQYEHEFFSSDFYLKNQIYGHPTAPVYAAMANALQELFEDAVKNNPDYFNDYIG